MREFFLGGRGLTGDGTAAVSRKCRDSETVWKQITCPGSQRLWESWWWRCWRWQRRGVARQRGLQEIASPCDKGVTGPEQRRCAIRRSVGRVLSIRPGGAGALALDGAAHPPPTPPGISGVAGLRSCGMTTARRRLDASDDQPSRIPLRACSSRLSDQGADAGPRPRVPKGQPAAGPATRKRSWSGAEHQQGTGSVDSSSGQDARLGAMGQQAGNTLVALLSTLARWTERRRSGRQRRRLRRGDQSMTAPGGTLTSSDARRHLNASGQNFEHRPAARAEPRY